MKRTRGGIQRHSIYNSLLLACLVSIIPLMLMFGIATKTTLDIAYNEKQQTMQTGLAIRVDQLEDEVERIRSVQRAMITNDDSLRILMHQYGRIGSYELGQRAADVHDSLRHLKDTSMLIQDTSIFYTEINREFSTNLYYNDNLTSDQQRRYIDSLPSLSAVFTAQDGVLYVAEHSAAPADTVLPGFFLYSRLDTARMLDIVAPDDEETRTMFHSDRTLFSDSADADPALAERLVYESSGSPEDTVQTRRFSIGDERYLMTWITSRTLGGTLVSWVPQSIVFGNLRPYTSLLWLLALVTLLDILFLVFQLNRLIKKPLDMLRYVFGRVEKGSLEIAPALEADNEFGELSHAFNTMVARLKDSIGQIYEKNANLKSAELKQLQAQISPHFLYNSFNILTHAIARNNGGIALQMSKALSRYFAYITQNNQEWTTLRNEFEFAAAYVEIQKIRFRDRIQVTLDMVEAPFASLPAPRMILQPLIENAYKHGFSDMVDKGVLRVGWSVQDKFLEISVEDNGPGVTPGELETLERSLESGENIGHNGICNVHQRLRLQFGEGCGLRLESEKYHSFRAVIVLPSRLPAILEDEYVSIAGH